VRLPKSGEVEMRHALFKTLVRLMGGIFGLLVTHAQAGLFTRNVAEWKLHGAELVGTNLYCIVAKETDIVAIIKPSYASSTPLDALPTEYALLKYPLHRTKQVVKPEAVVPLGRYHHLSHYFRLLPGATNLLVRVQDQKTYELGYECWSMNLPGTNIHVGLRFAFPREKTFPPTSGFWGAGKEMAVFLIRNRVVCLRLPNLTNDTTSDVAKRIQTYVDAYKTSKSLAKYLLAGDLDYFIACDEVEGRSSIAVIDLKGNAPLKRYDEDELWSNSVLIGANVINHQLNLLLKPAGNNPTYATFRDGQRINTLTLTDWMSLLSWPADSSQLVLEASDTEDQGRKRAFVIWNVETGENWRQEIEIPKDLLKRR
jgi:hypothetical protein